METQIYSVVGINTLIGWFSHHLKPVTTA